LKANSEERNIGEALEREEGSEKRKTSGEVRENSKKRSYESSLLKRKSKDMKKGGVCQFYADKGADGAGNRGSKTLASHGREKSCIRYPHLSQKNLADPRITQERGRKVWAYGGGELNNTARVRKRTNLRSTGGWKRETYKKKKWVHGERPMEQDSSAEHAANFPGEGKGPGVGSCLEHNPMCRPKRTFWTLRKGDRLGRRGQRRKNVVTSLGKEKKRIHCSKRVTH